MVVVFDPAFALCEYDGKPGCKTEIEMSRPWRNHCEPARYWTCVCDFNDSNCAAKIVSCPPGSGFMDSEEFALFGCVPWENYVWTKPYNPPSIA